MASESRSQHQNKRVAVRRLQNRLAIEIRQPFEPGKSDLHPRLTQANSQKRLEISQRDQAYPSVVGFVLDVLEATGWSISAAASLLDVTTAHVVGFLKADHELWAAVNRQRSAKGLRSLN